MTIDINDARKLADEFEKPFGMRKDCSYLHSVAPHTIRALCDRIEEGEQAIEGLLAFIREKYPHDFVAGGRGYVCPHHCKLAAWLRGGKA